MKKNNAYKVLSFDRWRAATEGLIQEAVKVDTVFFSTLVDATSMERLRNRCVISGDMKPTFTALVVKSISKALKEHPKMNRLVLTRWPFCFRPIQLNEIHAVVAVERVRKGLDSVYAGIIRDSDCKSVLEVSAELRDLALREEEEDARLSLFMRIVRRLPAAISRWVIGLPRSTPRLWLEHRGGSFALTSVGKYGVDSICGKWPWPLTFTYGKVKKRPIVVGDEIEARSSFHLGLGWRRDLCNGAPAARFFNRIVEILEHAEGELAPKAEVALINRVNLEAPQAVSCSDGKLVASRTIASVMGAVK